jgi:hypothetical protein
VSVASFPLVGTPTTGFVEVEIEPVRRQAMGVTEGGRDIVIDRGLPQWQGTWKTNPLTATQTAAWRAWKAALRGSARFFTLWDPLVEYPVHYMPTGAWPTTRATGGGAFDGTATIGNITTSGLADGGRDVLRIKTLPAGLVLSPGDGVQITESGLQSLHRILDPAGVTADSGGNVTVWVEPALPAQFDASAAAQLHRPSAKWRVTSCDITVQSGSRVRPGQVTLQAVSVLL